MMPPMGANLRMPPHPASVQSPPAKDAPAAGEPAAKQLPNLNEASNEEAANNSASGKAHGSLNLKQERGVEEEAAEIVKLERKDDEVKNQ